MIRLGYVENFCGAIVKNSIADNYDEAVKEWAYYGESFKEDGQCCCGHKIIDNRIVRNIVNKNSLIVGNCCINKFGIERRAFNGSKMAYLELGLLMARSPGSRDYLRFETKPRISTGKMFTVTDLEVLEKITGKTSRFRGVLDDWMWKKLERLEANEMQQAKNACIGKASLFDF